MTGNPLPKGHDLKGYDARGFCKRGDPDVPSIICGYPYPCPKHTIIIDMTKRREPVLSGGTATTPADRERAKEIGRAIRRGLEDPR